MLLSRMMEGVVVVGFLGLVSRNLQKGVVYNDDKIRKRDLPLNASYASVLHYMWHATK